MNKEKNEIAKKEEEILKFWQKNKIFKKSDKKEALKGEFIFYEGPPTANGKPGIHHLEARAFKDAISRYKTMQGFYVRRKAGWDTHGLPVEIEVEKELGLKSKKEIEEYGIAKFNKKCRESVWKYVDEWEKFTERIAFWLDNENPYITYEPEYMESVWNIVKKIHKQKLLYKDYRIANWCPRCGTGLSSHELALGYEDITDESVYVKFKIKKGQKIRDLIIDDNTYLLAWTTTPWTLLGNVALAVKDEIIYVIARIKNQVAPTGRQESGIAENIIITKDRIENIFMGKEYEIAGELKGKDIVGVEYEPLYPYLENTLPESEKNKMQNAYKIYSADFITTKEGTGIVHIAVMYGADDFELGTKEGLPKHHLVNEEGRFISGTDFLEGKDAREANVEIIENLDDKIYAKEKIKHQYPHCWRCRTPLIYFARDSWYIKMSDLRDRLVKENDSINWIPEYTKEGRFGEWLREVKDWAVSRERYWATPLPIWQNESGDIVIGSIDELEKYAKKSENKYFVMRHGEAENNVLNIISSKTNNTHHLTKKGIKETKKIAKELKKNKIDLIFSSPFARTRETAEIVSEEIGLNKEEIIFDKRIQEIQVGEFDGKSIDEYYNYFNSIEEYFEKRCPNGENYTEIKNRMGEFIYDIEKKYKNKNILIITHSVPSWMLFSASLGLDIKKTIEKLEGKKNFIKNAEVKKLDFIPMAHDENYELNLHRPYIDEIELEDEKGNKLARVKEVMDVWFDSGAMPFAQDHYPFENKERIEGKGYPADFISEAIDQTRGWFYTLHAIGVLMERGKAYKNVISLGHILDKKGKKMSKSLGNTVNPREMIDKYGSDALRFFMYAVNQPGDSKNFDEKGVDEAVKKVFNLLNNIINFYELYFDKKNEKKETKNKKQESRNILDQWITAKLDKLIADTTMYLDEYRIFESTRDIKDFIADFSQWYIRRSRERFKTDGEDKENALATTKHILLRLSKLMAPFTPFVAEQVYQKVKSIDMKESVHLETWPNVSLNEKIKNQNEKLLEEMKKVRKIVSLGLEARSSAGIKVRQPLSMLRIANQESGIKNKEQLLQLIKDEVNVKEIVFDENIENEVKLDTNLTQELKNEGAVRELMRAIQNARKEAKLMPRDFINLDIEADDTGREFIEKFANIMKAGAFIKEINFTDTEGEEINVAEYCFKFKIKK